MTNTTCNTEVTSLAINTRVPTAIGMRPPGGTFEYGEKSPMATLWIGIDSPTKDDLKAVGSAGQKQVGIAIAGHTVFLLFQYSLNGQPILSLDAPYHAGLPGNCSERFLTSIQGNLNALGESLNAGLLVTTVLFDTDTQLIINLNVSTLPNRTSKVLCKEILRQAAAPTSLLDHERSVDAAYRRYPNTRSLRTIAVVWQKQSPAHSSGQGE